MNSITPAANPLVQANPPASANPMVNSGAMANADPLAQLRDIHLPSPIAWWPPAPGWWLLAIALLLAIGFGGYFFWRRHKQRRYRRIALRNARTIYAQWQRGGDNIAFIQALNRLLKQTALVAFPHSQVAALNGDAWLRFLDSRLPAPQFDGDSARILADIYRPHIEHLQAETLQRAAEYWLRRHRC